MDIHLANLRFFGQRHKIFGRFFLDFYQQRPKTYPHGFKTCESY